MRGDITHLFTKQLSN